MNGQDRNYHWCESRAKQDRRREEKEEKENLTDWNKAMGRHEAPVTERGE